MADSVTDHVACVISYASMLKMEWVWYLSFQEEHLSVEWSGNLDSSIGNSDPEIRGSNPGRGSNFSLENLICKFYKVKFKLIFCKINPMFPLWSN